MPATKNRQQNIINDLLLPHYDPGKLVKECLALARQAVYGFYINFRTGRSRQRWGKNTCLHTSDHEWETIF